MTNNLYRTKWEKGKKSTLRFYKAKLPWKNKAFNRELFYLPDYFAQMIGDKKEVSIADLGAAMFCTIGSLWKTARVKVYPSDVLADDFNQILKEQKIKPLIPVMKEDMEKLSYPDNFFDIVHCVNALDHTVNPIKALQEMYRVCKPNGYIYLRHFVNVGEHEKYYGLHLWNIDISDGGDALIWNQENRFLLSDLFKGFKSLKERELDYKKEDMVVSILHK
jgi:SAM-dependent methyltransferase